MDEAHKELVKRLRALRIMDEVGSDNPLGREAADALEALAGEAERLKRMLFPYAEDKEISGVTWNGFYLIGNRKSVDEFKRLENRTVQLETYRAEFVRRNEAAEAERDRLKAALEDAKEMVISWGSYAPTYFAEKHDLLGDIEQLNKALGDAS